MKCDRIAGLLEDYQYGELGQADAAEVAVHLRECQACSRRLVMLENEAGIYAAYAAGVEKALVISPEMVEGALQNPSVAAGKTARGGATQGLSRLVPSASWARQAIAALLLVAVSVTATLLVVGHYRSQQALVPQLPDVQQGSSGEKGLNEALQSVQRAEQEYLKAINQLSALVEKQRPSLDPRIYGELQVNLRLIDDHIAATRSAYYAHPQDAELALYMLAAYNRKVALLQDLTS